MRNKMARVQMQSKIVQKEEVGASSFSEYASRSG